ENVEATDQMRVEVSANGGGSWTTLETFTGAFAASSRSYNITTSIASNTRIRFIQVGGYTGTDQFFVNNVQIKDSAITAGHWEVRVDMSSAVTAGDSINGFGLRAHDGTSGAGGTEFNVYADSMLAIGSNPPNAGTNTRTYSFHPYITSGCTCGQNDYDLDSNAGNIGSMVYTSRGGTFTQTFASATLSTNDVWNRDSVTGWTSDSIADDYGIWTLAATINSYLVAGTPNGNYATLYVSNWTAAANPPAANPAANTHRVYFGNDAGASPVKPYLLQQLTQRFNGTLPVGQTRRYTVTIRISNPTAWPIVFSAARLVTANIPGGTVVYNGSPQVSQGSVVSQPAIGGSGNITWNPGTVAAGADAILSYDVNVTATSAGQHIPIVGTPVSGNGTRATWLDETANANQARAIFTFGPLCEIAVNEGLATDVVVSSFDVAVRGGTTSIEWTTATEAGTIGFNLYRVDAATRALTRVNPSTIPTDPRAPQSGRHYRFADSGNAAAQPSYVLEELTASGKVNRYGPFLANGVSSAATPPPTGPAPAPTKRLRPSTTSSVIGNPPRPVAVMAGVHQTGIVRVTSTAISNAFFAPRLAIETGIRNGDVTVTSNGAPVAWTPSADGAAILFFGEAGSSIYSNDRVYRIEMKPGTRMSTVDVTPASAATTSFTASRELEVDAFVATVVPLDPESDYWFWDYVIPGDATHGQRSFAADVPAVASSTGAVLQVRLQGAASVPHKALVSMNGMPVGEVTWSALDATSTELNVPPAVLHEGANTISVEGVLDPGAGFDVFYVDGFTLRYTRAARPENGRLEMAATPGAAIAAGPFAAGALAFDITNRTQPVVLRGATPSGGTMSFVDPAAAQTLFLTDASALVTPSFVRFAEANSLADANNGADWVVIAPAALRASADALALLHQHEGLQTYVADLQRIYDEFAGGNATPHAIRAFIAATQNWQRKPRYVVLAGIGTLDYRGITVPPGLVPPLMVKTADGLFASDSRFVDFDLDGLPDLAIGRLPVSSAAELDAYVQKLDRNMHADGAPPLVFVADAQDRGADFRAHSGLVEAPLSTRPLTQLYVDTVGAGAARNGLLQSWQNGAPLVNWIGHGGIDRISNSALLTGDDVPALTSATRLPLFLAMTCSINRFELGDIDALGTTLTRAPAAGAIAVWSASGLSVNAEATDLERTFMQLAAKTPDARLGDLIVQSFAAHRDLAETGSVYLLLGDPALRIKLPKENQSGGTPQNGRE
ncbi:MAG: hypothetical protein JWO56_437, partial [Acidobacteria bacterium]|nr:hypothetical protein [Acidobacteriota bacterium]